jgi:hypothetical protein
MLAGIVCIVRKRISIEDIRVEFPVALRHPSDQDFQYRYVEGWNR